MRECGCGDGALRLRICLRGARNAQYNIDRLHKYQSNPEYRGARVVETLGRVCVCA